MNAALAGGPKKKEIEWTEDCQLAFVRSKEALVRATLLSHPSPSATTTLSVDASNTAIGAELAQLSATGKSQPLAFFSKALSSAEKKYSAFDRELLAIYPAIKHFRHCLLYTSPSPRDS